MVALKPLSVRRPVQCQVVVGRNKIWSCEYPNIRLRPRKGSNMGDSPLSPQFLTLILKDTSLTDLRILTSAQIKFILSCHKMRILAPLSLSYVPPTLQQQPQYLKPEVLKISKIAKTR